MELDLAGTITAAGGAVALILRALATRGHSRRSLERRITALEDQLLDWAEWAHDARLTAASNGVRLPAIPRPREHSDTDERETA